MAAILELKERFGVTMYICKIYAYCLPCFEIKIAVGGYKLAESQGLHFKE